MDLRIEQTASCRNALPAVALYAQRAEILAARFACRLQPFGRCLYGIRRRLATAGISLFTAWLFVHVMFGANGLVVYRQKKSEYLTLQKEIISLQAENESYTTQIKALQTDPQAIEKEAREQLHYARPGEVVYVAPPPPPRRSTDTARK